MATIETPQQLDEAWMSAFHAYHGNQTGEGVHGIAHGRNVAFGSEPVGVLLGLNPRVRLLARIAGGLHDIKRSSAEDPSLKDEEISAGVAVSFAEKLNGEGLFPTTSLERSAISYAVGQHGQYPEYWADPETRNLIPQDLAEQIRILNFVPDKADANGPQVIGRRSMFVAGERLLKPTGDWQQYGYTPEDGALVVAVESFVRLAAINPRNVYPYRLQPFVSPLYDVQIPFVNAICNIAGVTVEDIVQLLIERKRPDGKNYLDVRGLKVPRDVAGLSRLVETVGGVTNKGIESATPELVAATRSTLNYFSSKWQGNDYDTVVQEWNPTEQIAQEWRQGMLDYNSGRWFDQITQQILQSR